MSIQGTGMSAHKVFDFPHLKILTPKQILQRIHEII